MLSLKQTCHVSEDHKVTLTLPESVAPGEHEIVVVVDPAEKKSFDPMAYSGVIDWPVDGLDYQKLARNEWK